MATKPTPPAGLPKYLTDGIPKQDDESLRALREWIDALLDYRQDVETDDIEAGVGEEIETVKERSDGTVVIKKVSCGKDNCKCASGELHGPYKYIVRRQGGSLNWTYRGPASE